MGTEKPQPKLDFDQPSDAGLPPKRLDSWKEIAAYLKRDIRTIQRWEKFEGLPVHRHMHGKQGSVYAHRAELDAWWSNGRSRLEALEHSPAAMPRVARAWWAAGAMLLSIGAGLFAIRTLRSPLPPPGILGYTQLTNDGLSKSPSLTTDGSRIYFIEATPEGTTRLASVPVAGGDPVAIATPFLSVGPIDVSPRRPELLVTIPELGQPGFGLWILPLPGGTPRRVEGLTVDSASWSPDGDQIAYSKGPDLYVAKRDGSDSHRLATAPGRIDEPRWSPDKKVLRFRMSEPGRQTFALWEVAANGTGLQPLLPGWKKSDSVGFGSWTPDGNYFVFGSVFDRRQLIWDIWAMREGRGFFHKTRREPVKLPAGPINFWAPVPSPDGKKLFVVGVQHRSELVRYDARLHEFVPFLGGISANWASFSRDGQWVAYVSIPQWTVWRSKPDGSQRLQLTFPPLEADGLAWSPDGKQVAVRARTPGRPWKIYILPAQGGTAQPLTGGSEDEGIPTWSRDMKRIVFGDVPAVFGKDNGHYALHVYDLETHQMSDLPGSKGLWTSRWSPDGRYVAALTIADRPKLQLFDLRTQQWRALGGTSVNNPVWSQDGKYIYFDDVADPPAIYRVRISDHTLERIANLRGFGRAQGWGCGLAPDDSPLVTRDVRSEEIYALDVDLP